MPDARPCSRCGEEPRYPGQRWGRRCLTGYTRARRARRWRPAPLFAELGVRPADLPALVAGLIQTEEEQALYDRYVTNVDLLRHLLRFGLETVRARGYGR